MKRLHLLAVSAFLLASHTISAEAGRVSVTYYFGDPRIETSGDGYSSIFFPSTVQAGKAGGPAFPFRGIKILLPPGEEASEMSIVRRGWKDIGGNILLHPRQHPLPGDEKERGDKAFLYDESAYSSPDWIHPPSAGPGTHFYRGHSIATGSFTPVGFHPSTKSAGYYSEVEVRIETAPSERSSAALSLFRSDRSTVRYLQGLIDNPAAAASYDRTGGTYAADGDGYEYLIITRSILEDDFAPLRDFYTRRGLRSEIMTVEDINRDFPGTDAPERIRNAIIEEYVTSGITHVLIAGDGDPFDPATVPYRGLTGTVISSTVYYDDDIPADLYYAALDGDWNADGDDLWGEPGDDGQPEEADFFSEISVGRAPVDSPEEAAAFINKTVSYQESPVSGHSRNVLLLGEFMYGDPLTYSGDEMDQLVGTCTAWGFTTTGFPPELNITRHYEREADWDRYDVFDAVNSGTNWISHGGHANWMSVMKLSYFDVDEDYFTNDGITANFPIVYTWGCSAGAFDQEESIGEKSLRIKTFASAFVGNSRYGWFTEGTTNGPSHHFQREFFDAVFSEGYSELGSANQRSKDQTVPFLDLPDEYEPGAHRWVFYCLNLLGDPAMDGWTDTPSDMAVYHAPGIVRNASSFPVETGVEGSLAALYWDGTCYGRGLAGPGGDISILLPEPINSGVDSMIITVTAHDRHHHRDTLSVDPAETPAVTTLYQNYPNPFNAGTNIFFSLKEDCRVEIRVYDAAGRDIGCIFSGDLEAGDHTVPWDAGDLSSGIYFYRLIAGGTERSRKAVILR